MKIEPLIPFKLQTQVSHPKPQEFLLQENVYDGARALFSNVVSRPSGAPWKRRQPFAD